MAAIDAAMEKLAKAHAAHIAVYGVGKLETCNIATFKAGVADRGCSLRVPRPVALAGAGYFEDRRPAANADPYTVVRMLLTTVLKR
jgi:glutamine synthetase